MAATDYRRLEAHYAEVIAQMPDTFTSHQFILKLAQQYQVEYIDVLYDSRHMRREGKPVPFMMVHRALADKLNDFPQLVRQSRPAVDSIDIFGNSNTASEWKRIK